jgi:hypothetical protein
MVSQVSTYHSRLGFSFSYDTSDSSEGETGVDQPSHSLIEDSRYVHVKFKNSKAAPKTIEKRSLQRVKEILKGSFENEDPNETSKYYSKALESNEVLPSHKLLLLFHKPKKTEWPFPT